MLIQEIENIIDKLEKQSPLNKKEIVNSIMNKITGDNEHIHIIERLAKLGGDLYSENPLEVDKLQAAILIKQEKFFIHFSNQLNLSQKQLEKYVDSMIVNNSFDAFKHLKSLNFDYSFSNQVIFKRCAMFGRKDFFKFLIEDNDYQWTTKAFCNAVKITTIYEYRETFDYLTLINDSDIILSVGLSNSYKNTANQFSTTNCIFNALLKKGANPNHKYIINDINRNEHVDLNYIQLLLDNGINPTKLNPINKEAAEMVKPYLEKYNLYHKLDSNIQNKQKTNKTKI